MHKASFRRLAMSHLDLVYGAAMRATRSRELAEDLVQETYRVAFERWNTLRDPAACRAWLLRILYNAYIDERRRRLRLVPIEGNALEVEDTRASADPCRSAQVRLSFERLDAALDRLPADSRWLFILRELEGLSYQELAEALGIPIGTVRSRLARLRVNLIVALSSGGVAKARSEKEGGGE
jgi:RNA polymerase sigma-70 factor (ECF subfamily)